MNALSISCLLLGAATLAPAQALPKKTQAEAAAAQRWSELNADRIAGNANGQPITLSDLRRQLAPFVEEIGRGKSDAEFNQAIANYAEEALKQITDRQLGHRRVQGQRREGARLLHRRRHRGDHPA